MAGLGPQVDGLLLALARYKTAVPRQPEAVITDSVCESLYTIPKPDLGS
jgi:hypothetical protein